MIKSEVGRGEIYAGDTSLALSIEIKQTGPMQLTVSKGDFVKQTGETFTLANDVVLDLTSDPVLPKHYRIELGTQDGAVDVLARSKTSTDPRPPVPVGWKRLHTLTICDSQEQNWEFIVPSGLVNLADIDIFVLTVKLGFPSTMPAGEMHQGRTG